MYSAVLDSFDKKNFLNMVKACAELWETDAFYSGAGFHGEDESVCCVLPVSRLRIGHKTPADEIREYISSDDMETFGFLSYDFGMSLREVHTEKELMKEAGLLKKYTALASHTGGMLKIESDCPVVLERMITAYESFQGIAETDRSTKIICNMTGEQYADSVRKVLEYIKDGHTYQLNLSMKYEAYFSTDPYALWAEMAVSNPAPFYSIFKTDDGCIISSSPERFLKVEDGEVLSQPIKGTYRFDEYAPELEKKLTNSPKESAELSMIVDLIRNDISGSCRVGSVRVDEHKSVMRVDNLLQMYSSVRGELADGKDVIDLLLDAFPGGSVTGCPKKRSMELIDSLEPHARGVYCGSMVRIKDMMNMDSSITIRTGYYRNGKLSFYAGSGIVADSVPEKEYEESVSKAAKFLRL